MFTRQSLVAAKLQFKKIPNKETAKLVAEIATDLHDRNMLTMREAISEAAEADQYIIEHL